MSDIIILIITILLIIIVIIGALYTRNEENNLWNNGKCSNCREDWELKDYDSQGGRLYMCSKCGNTIWIDYKVDKYKN